MATTVTDLDKQNKVNLERGFYNIIDAGIRTGKTYWATHELIRYTRDGNPARILFLTDTAALKDQIILDYFDKAMEGDLFWEMGHENKWGYTPTKMGVMCYQRLAQHAIKDDLDFLKDVDVIVWDECDTIFNFAAQAFTVAYKTDFSRKNATRAEVLSIIQKYSSRPEYASLILLGAWESIIAEGRILCIGLSATPDRANEYYNQLVKASIQGRLTASYRLEGDFFYYNLMSVIHCLIPKPGRGYWVYSPWIENNRKIVEAAKSRGFRAIELHSKNNNEKPMDEEQRRVYDYIISTHMVPPEYDFIVFNDALMRGITLLDDRFDMTIIDSILREAREQVTRQLFPNRRLLKTAVPRVPDEYMNRFLTLDECRQLADEMEVHEIDSNSKGHNGKTVTWNRLKELLSLAGYTISSESKRIGGSRKTCYKITGEWHYVEVADEKFNELLEAKIEENDSFTLESNSGQVFYDPNLQIPEELAGKVWTH